MCSVLERGEASRLLALWTPGRVRALWAFIAFVSTMSKRDRRVRSRLYLNDCWLLPNSKRLMLYGVSLNLSL